MKTVIIPFFRFWLLNKLNKELLFQLQEKEIAVLSNTMHNGNFAIRVAITNHRSKMEDFKLLISSVLEIAQSLDKRRTI